jgi:hypothetical protein
MHMIKLPMNIAVMVIGGMDYSNCSAIPKLTTFMITFGVMNSLVGLISFWFNIPDDMKEKEAIKKASESNAHILNALSLFQLAFLGVAIWGFSQVAPYIGDFPAGPDGCESGVFLCGFISSAIPTVIVAFMVFYGLVLLVKKSLGMEVALPWEEAPATAVESKDDANAV